MRNSAHTREGSLLMFYNALSFPLCFVFGMHSSLLILKMILFHLEKERVIHYCSLAMLLGGISDLQHHWFLFLFMVLKAWLPRKTQNPPWLTQKLALSLCSSSARFPPFAGWRWCTMTCGLRDDSCIVTLVAQACSIKHPEWASWHRGHWGANITFTWSSSHQHFVFNCFETFRHLFLIEISTVN